jgi:hypothetical protein
MVKGLFRGAYPPSSKCALLGETEPYEAAFWTAFNLGPSLI